MIDGDTVELADGRRLRLCCVDTPETWRPECPAEAAAGAAATAAVEAWIAGAATVTVRIDRCCDRYGRLIGDVVIDRVPLSDRLTAAGLGLPYAGGTRPDWCAILP